MKKFSKPVTIAQYTIENDDRKQIAHVEGCECVGVYDDIGFVSWHIVCDLCYNATRLYRESLKA